MRQTVTLFRSRYEGSNPSHLKDPRMDIQRKRKAKEKKEMTKVNQERVKERRKTKKRKKRSGSGKKGEEFLGQSRRKTRRKLGKRNLPQYVRGVPRRPSRTVEKALRKVYGIGRVKAKEVCKACGRRPSVRVGNLEVEHVQLVESWRMENVVCSSDRRRIEYDAVSRHLKLGTVRGMNMRRGLPVRGQRTSTNGMTARTLNKQRGRKVRQ
jgi:small subunit ribosomal protein S13